MNVVAIVQVRTGSTRLPAKILEDIMGKTMLWHFFERIKKSKLINKIVIATTTKERDNVVVEFAKENSFEFYRGSEDDVLDRFYQTARIHKADPVVRVTPDCPLIDPQIVDEVIKQFLESNYDYICNTYSMEGKPVYPPGFDVEIFSYGALEKAWRGAKDLLEREHVTLYFRRHPELFKIGSVGPKEDLSHIKLDVDYARDLKFVREIYKRLHKEGEIFYLEDILNLLKKYPALMDINKK